jgi:PIN domain nuclease of toxin-antitoxin system
MGSALSTLLLDSHVVHWWSSEPQRLSAVAARAIRGADELAVASITWYELARLAERERITLSVPHKAWLEGLATQLRTVGISPAIAFTAASLPSSFPGDPADRLIYATAIEYGWPLVSKDERLRHHRHPIDLVVW